MTKQDLLDLVAQNKLRELEKKLNTTIEENNRLDLKDELVQLKGLHHHYRQNIIERTKEPEDLDIEAAQLRKSFILFIEQLFEKPVAPTDRIRSSRWFWLFLTFVLCIGLILIGSMKWPNIDFVLEGRTSYLAFRIDQNWDFNQDIYLDEFLSFTVKSLELDTFQLSAPEGEPLEEIIFSGGQIKWQEIDLPANAVLNFDLVDGQLNSQAFVDSLRCLFALRNANLEIPNQGFNKTIGSDSSLVLAEIILSEGPQMAFIPTQDSMFAFRLVPVSGLEFQRTDLEDDRGMQSEIIDGQVMTRGIDYDLKNKPYVDIIEPESTTLSFHQQGDYFMVRVEGKARDLTIGARPDTQESVKPTMIEHFGKSANANLIWNWIVGIVGLLSGIVGLLPKRKKS